MMMVSKRQSGTMRMGPAWTGWKWTCLLFLIVDFFSEGEGGGGGGVIPTPAGHKVVTAVWLAMSGLRDVKPCIAV